MRRTSRLLVLFGIGLAVLTFVLIVALLPGQGNSLTKATPTPPTIVQVVEATADIPLGTVVTKDMLTAVPVPANVAAPDSFPDTSLVIGQTARRAILSGAQIHQADFSLTQTSFVVPAGKRAMAITVDQLTGVGKMIYPGDTVDVVITLDDRAIKIVTVQPPNKSPFTFPTDLNPPLTVKAPVLLQDIQVIGTLDAATAQPAAGASPAPSGGATLDLSSKKLIVLAVTDAQAEAILFARTGGTIDLVLRAPADAGTTANTSGVILKTLFDTYGVLPPYLIKAIDAYIPQQP